MRTKAILKEFPHVRKLIGKNPFTIFAIIGLVGFQITVAFFMSRQPWWLSVLVAYFFGAFAGHALFVMIHECAHKLLFKKQAANKLAGMLANTPLLFPSSVTFERYHLKHHSFQGIHELDGDIPNRWEARLINNYFFGKVIWLLFYPFFQLFRLSRLKEIKAFDGWVILNAAIQVAFVAAITWFFGPKATLYLLYSFFFSVGFHPLGARWVQEHFLTHGQQETYSYYGVLNNVSFNVGYHNEHHDFPSVPWNKLPRIKKAAPSFYNSLASHRSWTKLFFRFIFSKELSLFHRLTRTNRGKVPLTDNCRPDIDLAK
jgi:sphingolipid delta-4 desaturase